MFSRISRKELALFSLPKPWLKFWNLRRTSPCCPHLVRNKDSAVTRVQAPTLTETEGSRKPCVWKREEGSLTQVGFQLPSPTPQQKIPHPYLHSRHQRKAPGMNSLCFVEGVRLTSCKDTCVRKWGSTFICLHSALLLPTSSCEYSLYVLNENKILYEMKPGGGRLMRGGMYNLMQTELARNHFCYGGVLRNERNWLDMLTLHSVTFIRPQVSFSENSNVSFHERTAELKPCN